jgi:hypothetical protein
MSKKHVLYCSGSGICIVHVPIPVLFLFWYPHCRSSGTPSHPVPEGSTVNRYLHSHLVPTVIPMSMSYGTHTPCHPVLSSSGTNTALIRYSKSSGTRRFYKSSGTHTPCHPVLTLHIIIRYSQFNTSSTRMFQKPSGTRMLQVIRYQHQQQSGTRNNSKFWKVSRGKSGTWVLSRATFTCRHMSHNSPISHVWTSSSGGMILQKLVKISNCQLAPRFSCRWNQI